MNNMSEDKVRLVVPKEMLDVLKKSRVGYSMAKEIAQYCEETGIKVWNPERQSFSGCLKRGNLICWAEYQMEQERQCRLLDVYYHRIQIAE